MTTVMSITGPTVFVLTKGNTQAANLAAEFESFFTAGVNGGMTGRLLDEGLTGAEKLIQASDMAQNFLDALGIDAGCGGG